MADPSVKLPERFFVSRSGRPNGASRELSEGVYPVVCECGVMCDDYVHLTLSQRVDIVVVSSGCDNAHVAVVVLSKSAHQFVVEACLKAMISIHVVSEVYGAYKLLACKCVYGAGSAEHSSLFTKGGHTYDHQCHYYVS